jgi:hypothetical protein
MYLKTHHVTEATKTRAASLKISKKSSSEMLVRAQ